MKKMLSVVCMLCVGMSASAANNKLDFSDLSYVFNYSKYKCEAQEFKMKKFIFEDYNLGNIIVTDNIKTLPGNVVTAVTELNGREMNFVFASTYGACRFFEDVGVKKMKVDPKNYINLKEKK